MAEEKKVLPGHETQTGEMNCPSCERFVGAKSKCPYCGAKVNKRMSLMATRYAAIFLATFGMFCLWMMAKGKDVPVVKIGDIQPTMNFGQIRVDGQVDSDARTFRTGGMGFQVSDGTGSIQVFVSQNQAKELTHLNKVPLAGDKILLMGTLNLDDERSSMRLQSLDSMKLERAPAPLTKIADVDDSFVGGSINIQGQVAAFIPPEAGSKRPYTLQVKDDSGVASITFWQAEYEQIQDKDHLADAFVRVRVAVGEYRGKLQLQLSNGMNLEIIDPEAAAAPAAAPQSPAKRAAQRAAEQAEPKKEEAPKRDFSRGRIFSDYQAIKEIGEELNGQKVRIKGRVASVTEPEAGSNRPWEIVLYGEDGGSITVKYWAKTASAIPSKPAPGLLYDIEGVVEVFRGRPSITVNSGYAVKFITNVPPSEPTVDISQAVPISTLSPERKGETVVLVGTLGPDSALKSGVKFPLTDESDTVEVILWAGRIPAELREEMEEGVRVAVRGEVSEYNGELNVAAAPGYSLMVLE